MSQLLDRSVIKIKEICDTKEDVFRFIEQFCYIKDKKTNIRKPIKLSTIQKEFINYLNNYGTVSDKRTFFTWKRRY